MDSVTLKQEISRLIQAILDDLPIREHYQYRGDLGRLLLHIQEFLLDEDYWSFVKECGLSRDETLRYISEMLKRHSYRWKL